MDAPFNSTGVEEMENSFLFDFIFILMSISVFGDVEA